MVSANVPQPEPIPCDVMKRQTQFQMAAVKIMAIVQRTGAINALQGKLPTDHGVHFQAYWAVMRLYWLMERCVEACERGDIEEANAIYAARHPFEEDANSRCDEVRSMVAKAMRELHEKENGKS